MCLADIFILSCFIGYFAVWSVTPVLHSPLMSVTNAISGIVILGAFEALNNVENHLSQLMLGIAIFFAAVNIFGGFAVSARQLNMFKPKKDKKDA